MNLSPAISVIMPVYNYACFLKESIDSVLAQTMPDFELIVVNDGSSDQSSEIVHSYLDTRIKVIDFPENRGCYPARNAGMRAAAGKYICVMDADDVCFPWRLEKQYSFLEENSDIALIGGTYQILNSNLHIFRETDYETIKLLLLRFCYLCHPTCMVRTSVIESHDLYYNELYTYASDYDWQVRVSTLFPVSNITNSILLHREHDLQISSNKKIEQGFFADQIRINQLSFLGIEPTESEKGMHINFIKGARNEWISDEMIDQWIIKLAEANRKTSYYSQEKLQDFLQAHRYQYFHQNDRI